MARILILTYSIRPYWLLWYGGIIYYSGIIWNGQLCHWYAEVICLRSFMGGGLTRIWNYAKYE